MKSAALIAILGLAAPVALAPVALAQNDWPTYGHDSGGDRFSPLKQITPANVTDLKVAWVYHMKPSSAPAMMPPEARPRRTAALIQFRPAR